MNQRLAAYRRMASARTMEEVGGLLEELRDRYGPPPGSVLNLAAFARIRLLADRVGLEALDREGSTAVLKFRPDAKLDPVLLLKLVERRGDLTLLPPAILRLDLAKPEAAAGAAQPAPRPATAPRPEGPGRRRGAAPAAEGEASPSWWTARATAGEVAPGFTRDEILAERAFDPAAPGGLLERLGGVLAELSNAIRPE
jgi:transcription-repair coupling factor (superfamily II helicase)